MVKQRFLCFYLEQTGGVRGRGEVKIRINKIFLGCSDIISVKRLEWVLGNSFKPQKINPITKKNFFLLKFYAKTRRTGKANKYPFEIYMFLYNKKVIW